MLSQLKALIRPMYSSPPAHYAKVAGKILGDAALMQVRTGLASLLASSRCQHPNPQTPSTDGRHRSPTINRPRCAPQEWTEELKGMAARIQRMRVLFLEALLVRAHW